MTEREELEIELQDLKDQKEQFECDIRKKMSNLRERLSILRAQERYKRRRESYPFRAIKDAAEERRRTWEKRRFEAIQMRHAGCTYSEIADYLGVSNSRAFQIVRREKHLEKLRK